MTAPQPGVDQLDDLLLGSTRAGLPVSWRVDGDRASVSESTGLALYRIIQESITNAARHSPGGPIEVAVAFGPQSVSALVNNGPSPLGGNQHSASETTGGNGIRGMRERASAVGGMLLANRRQDGGFEVRAELPSMPA